MEEKFDYLDFKKLTQYNVLRKHGLNLLAETIESFFGCQVEIFHYPKRDFKEIFNIDIHENEKRGFYPLDENKVLILGRIFKSNFLITSIGFGLTGIDVTKSSKLLNIFENILSHNLTIGFKNYFEDATLIFGDEIIKQTITEYVSRGAYDSRQIRHLIEYFFKLRTTSFEGKYFSTGAIFTKSTDMFDGTFDTKRFGSSKKLTNPFYISITEKIDKRIWYLVDGQTTFFLGNKNLCFNNLFILNEEYSKSNFLEAHSLALTLKGGDFLIKVENEKLLSIITSDGSEFLFFENKWKYRNYNVLKELLATHISANDKIINSILFYILNCSKKQISTILWFPKDMKDIDQYINTDTKNSFVVDNLFITDTQAINHIFRCFSSDGVSVIDNLGKLIYIGVIVDISKAVIKGIAGTGESAASVLSKNGLSIKVSQDGVIKIFTEDRLLPYYF
jgi:hypothetical protein